MWIRKYKCWFLVNKIWLCSLEGHFGRLNLVEGIPRLDSSNLQAVVFSQVHLLPSAPLSQTSKIKASLPRTWLPYLVYVLFSLIISTFALISLRILYTICIIAQKKFSLYSTFTTLIRRKNVRERNVNNYRWVL